MKLATYIPNNAQSPRSGIGAVVGNDIADLNYAYARYLREEQGEFRAYELAAFTVAGIFGGFSGALMERVFLTSREQAVWCLTT